MLVAHVVVLGSTGLVGKALQQTAPPRLHITWTTRNTVQITCPEALQAYLQTLQPDYVINAVAYTQVVQAEQEREAAIQLNVQLPAQLAHLAEQQGYTLFHLSTDYVFGLGHNAPIPTTATPAPLNHYGKTKAQGEQLILTKTSHAFILRTAWLYYDPVMWLQQKINAQHVVNMVNDQIGSPTYVIDLAQVIWQMIKKHDDHPEQYLPGMYHYVHKGAASWYDFTCAIQQHLQWPIQVLPISTNALAAAVQRPPYSVLATDQCLKKWGIKIPHWQVRLTQCLKKNV